MTKKNKALTSSQESPSTMEAYLARINLELNPSRKNVEDLEVLFKESQEG